MKYFSPYKNKARKQLRLGVLLDLSNLYHGHIALGMDRIDHKGLLDHIINNRWVEPGCIIGYTGHHDTNTKFINFLRANGMTLITKPLRVRESGVEHCNFDVELTADALFLAPHVDIMAIGTGDGDFKYLVEKLKLCDITTEIYAFSSNCSHTLPLVADKFEYLDKHVSS